VSECLNKGMVLSVKDESLSFVPFPSVRAIIVHRSDKM